ncbi:pollen-specific leucine-rich repeat extensin-like protein 1 [Lytechinus variegatus]|uniref:pollen-specific leucine-rich repeat extensin-like protein 1 n=1 Tax=Lytechinus variegatus TaxID=7654 RepID=UPI001BB1DFF8|nr:pollen-specific leucine-rich repeat extensin-like protein 1 [Lytechinus variegatus]
MFIADILADVAENLIQIEQKIKPYVQTIIGEAILDHEIQVYLSEIFANVTEDFHLKELHIKTYIQTVTQDACLELEIEEHLDGIFASVTREIALDRAIDTYLNDIFATELSHLKCKSSAKNIVEMITQRAAFKCHIDAFIGGIFEDVIGKQMSPMEPSKPTPQKRLLTPPSVQPPPLPPQPEPAMAPQSEQLRVSAPEPLQLAATQLELQSTPPPKPLPVPPSEYQLASRQIAKLPTPPKPVPGPSSEEQIKVQPAALQAPQPVPQSDPLPVPPSESMQASPLAAVLPASTSNQLTVPPVALPPVQPLEQLPAPQCPLPVPPSESILPVQLPEPPLAPPPAGQSLLAAPVLSVKPLEPVIAPSDLLSEPPPAAWLPVQPPEQLLSPQTVALPLLQPEPLHATPMQLQEFPSEPPLARQPGGLPEPPRESRPDPASGKLAGQLLSNPKSFPSSGELHAKIPSLTPLNPKQLPVLDIAWDDRNPLKIWVERAQDLLDKSEPIPFPPPIGRPPVPNAIQSSPVLLLRQELLNGRLDLNGKDSQQTETGECESPEIGYSGSAVHRGRSFITYKLHQNHCASRESMRQHNSGSMCQQVITTSDSTGNTSTNRETCNTRRNPVRRSSDQSYLRRGYRGHTNRR